MVVRGYFVVVEMLCFGWALRGMDARSIASIAGCGVMQLELLAPVHKAVLCDNLQVPSFPIAVLCARARNNFLSNFQCNHDIHFYSLTMDQEKATLPILPPARWAGPSAPMKRPREIACFSYTSNHEYRPDASGLRYYYPPRLGADLCKGFESFEKLDDSPDDHLDSLLKTIMGAEEEVGKKLEVDVVTWRGMMTKLLACPFEERDG